MSNRILLQRRATWPVSRLGVIPQRHENVSKLCDTSNHRLRRRGLLLLLLLLLLLREKGPGGVRGPAGRLRAGHRQQRAHANATHCHAISKRTHYSKRTHSRCTGIVREHNYNIVREHILEHIIVRELILDAAARASACDALPCAQVSTQTWYRCKKDQVDTQKRPTTDKGDRL